MGTCGRGLSCVSEAPLYRTWPAFDRFESELDFSISCASTPLPYSRNLLLGWLEKLDLSWIFKQYTTTSWSHGVPAETRGELPYIS